MRWIETRLWRASTKAERKAVKPPTLPPVLGTVVRPKTRGRDLRKTALIALAIGTLVGTLVVKLVPVAISVAIPHFDLFGFQHQAADEKRLLYQIDHAALSAACERVWQKREAVRRFGAVYPQQKHTMLLSTHPVFPTTIQSLRRHPGWVHLDTGTAIRIEMGGGFCHYGFEWNPVSTPSYGTGQFGAPYSMKQVATNLWFYTEKPKLPDAK